MRQRGEWRTSGMTARSGRGLPVRGEQASTFNPWRRILALLSSSSPRLCRNSDAWLVAALVLVPAGATVSASTDDSREPIPALQLLEEELRANCGAVEFRVEWQARSVLWNELSVLEEVSAVTVKEHRDECPDRVVARVSGTRDGRRTDYLIPGNVELYASVYRAVRSLRAGTLVDDNDVELEEGWVSPSILREGERSVAGAYLEESIPSGRHIERAVLRDPPLVRRGQMLTVLYRTAGIELRGRSKARTDGWLGDRFRIRVEGSQKDCEVEVTGPNEVVVTARGMQR